MDRAHSRGHFIAPGVLACLLLASCPWAFALDPALDISQYAHTSWKIREGFSKGTITVIAQTPDGYLWLGTEFGLLRFDGVRNVPWQPPTGQQLPHTYIRSLLAARDGRLWIGTTEGLASWKDGKLTSYPEVAGLSINALLEDREGTVWAGAQLFPTGRLCAIQNGRSQCYGQDGSLGRWVVSLYEDSKGYLWAAAENGMWRWKPGPPKLYPLPDRIIGTLQSLTAGGNAGLSIATLGGIRQLVDGKVEAFPLPATRLQVQPRNLLRDRNGGLWIGTDQGLLHVHQGRTDVFARFDGLSGDYISRLFEDREGNIWVATSDGLDRFREFAAATLSENQGLSNALVMSVLAVRDGSVFLNTRVGLNRWDIGPITVYRKRRERRAQGAPPYAAEQSAVREIVASGLPDGSAGSLFQDDHGRIWVGSAGGVGYLEDDRFVPISGVPGGFVNSITEDTLGNLWIVNQNLGLFRLSQGDVQQIPWSSLGHNDPVYRLAADPVQGGLWLGFSQGGVAYFDGQIRASYAATNGLGKGRVNYLRVDHDGTLWAGTEGGLSRLKNGRVATLTSQSGLPCDSVDWVLEDDADSFWLYTVCGLVRIARSELDAWTAAVDKDENAKLTIRTTVFDSSDGVRSTASVSSYSPHAAKSADGKLWFAGEDGVSVVDPRHLPYNSLPPPVNIEQITADRKTYDVASAANGQMRLPPLIRDLEIDYTALSFVAPEKVRFRYKLEGRDRDWQDAGNRRQAFYNDLPPGNHRFRVSASNNSGVWNEAGTFLDLSIAPAYYQTAWFYALCGAVFLALVAALYQLRLRQVARQFNTRMDERMRIAQDLHDTLLQGCLSASMQLYLAVDRLPDDSPVKGTLTRVQQLMVRVIDDGRSALRGLRLSDSGPHDLEEAFHRVPTEVAMGEQVNFRVIAQGKPRPLHSLIRNEVFRIGREAIVNAFRHAHARNIEVEVDYAPRRLRVLVRDDGRGIDPSLLSSGRDGHWGLSGMRERAERIGGCINVSSRKTAGTEVDLSVPGKVAFQIEPSNSRVWLAKLTGKSARKTQSGDGR